MSIVKVPTMTICFCLQAASDFYFVSSIRMVLVAAICMICLVKTLGGSFILNLFVVLRPIAPQCTPRKHSQDDGKDEIFNEIKLYLLIYSLSGPWRQMMFPVALATMPPRWPPRESHAFATHFGSGPGIGRLQPLYR